MTAAERAVRRLVAEQVEAWNRGDAAAYGAACLAEVGFTNIVGMRWDTRVGHVARHAEMFRGAFAGSRLTIEVERVLLVGRDTVLAELLTTLTGFRGLPPGIRASRDGRLRTRMLEVFVRRGRRWWIAACHNTAVRQDGPARAAENQRPRLRATPLLKPAARRPRVAPETS